MCELVQGEEDTYIYSITQPDPVRLFAFADGPVYMNWEMQSKLRKFTSLAWLLLSGYVRPHNQPGTSS